MLFLVRVSNSKWQMYLGFLSSLSLSPQPPRQCLGPTCHLSSLNEHCIASAALSIHMMGWETFRGAQKEDDDRALVSLY